MTSSKDKLRHELTLALTSLRELIDFGVEDKWLPPVMVNLRAADRIIETIRQAESEETIAATLPRTPILEQTKPLAKLIADASKKRPSSASDTNQISVEIVMKAFELSQTAGGMTAYSLIERTGSWEARLRTAIENSNQMHKQSFSKIQDRAETLIQKLESKAASADVKYHANAWKEVARGQNMRAWGWLLAAIAFGLGLAAFISLGFEGLTDSSWPQIVHRLTATSLLLSGVFLCMRMHTTAMHNRIIAEHRQRALETFDSFVGAASTDPATRNAVLLQTVAAIFAPRSTGLGGKEAGDGSSPLTITEIVKTVNSVSKS